MALFDFLKNKDAAIEIPAGPYSEPSTNLIYNLLFCDNVALYKTNTPSQKAFPFNVLFNENSTVDDLQKIVDDHRADPRVRILAYNLQVAKGHTPTQKELLAVIVEIGFNAGPDVLASFNNGTARYINQTGKILIWETADATSAELTKNLFEHSGRIVQQIGPWDQPRRPHPATGMARITFLVSDGLYFGEAPLDALFNDALAGPALGAAAQLMKYLIGKSMEAEEKKA